MRLEDPALLRGEGIFVDDIVLDGMLHLAILRSQVAHARLVSVDVGRARAHPGVAVAWAHRDLPQPVPPLPNLRPHPALRARTPFPLAVDRVRYVGEPVALVAAETRYQAEDALEEIAVVYDPLPVVADLRAAAERGAVLVHEDLGSNVCARVEQRAGDFERVLAAGARCLTRTLHAARTTGHPIETRGVVAAADRATGTLTVWASCQRPHQNRRIIAAMLGLPEDRVRVIAPHVGGGFGPKGRFYPEDYLVPLLAWRLGRPVKWIEDRREHLLATTHEREQIHEVTAAFAPDGRLLGLRDRFLHDMGAYVSAGIVVPLNTAYTLPGPYRIPNVAVEGLCVHTTRMATSPVRGAGQPEAAFVIEHMVEAVARTLEMDPVVLRQRNLVPADAMPYAVGLCDLDDQPIVYDSGDFPACLERAAAAVQYATVRAQQPAIWRGGGYRGVAVACYVEATGVGPEEVATVGIDVGGTVTVTVGGGSQGQGHATMLARVCAAELDLDPHEVRVVEGDTAQAARSMGTYGSRSAVVLASAVCLAARRVRTRLLASAAARLGTPAERLELDRGRIRPRGSSGPGIGLGEAAGGQGIRENALFAPPRPTTASGAHAAVVDVDPDTGAVRIVRYAVVHDCGRMLDPAIVEGQVRGGVAHGIAETLYERLVYDDEGQLLTTTLKDYVMPTAAEMPDITIEHVETPSPLNALGVKGAGEGGIIPVAAVLSLAVQDALAPLGAVLASSQVAPEALREILRSAGLAAAGSRGGGST
jgi:CO/xanthine dehydrogenase Mo-binding subunit